MPTPLSKPTFHYPVSAGKRKLEFRIFHTASFSRIANVPPNSWGGPRIRVCPKIGHTKLSLNHREKMPINQWILSALFSANLQIQPSKTKNFSRFPGPICITQVTVVWLPRSACARGVSPSSHYLGTPSAARAEAVAAPRRGNGTRGALRGSWRSPGSRRSPGIHLGSV